jgi:hypothetical protein
MLASRARLAAVVAVVAAAAVAVALVFAGGAGGDDGVLAWKGPVRIFDSGIPTDKILYTQVRNASLQEVDLVAKDVRALDADGDEVFSATRFLAAFAHGIFPYSERRNAGDFERRRLGEIARLKPGESMPVTLSWRVPKGEKAPVRIDFGPAVLDLPAGR